MASEQNIQSECMLALSKIGCMVFRNNTGVLPGHNGRPVKFGLCVGSSDIIGICPDGKFLAVEVKSKRGLASDAQKRFIGAVALAGGRSGIARSPKEAVDIATGND